MKDWRTWAWIAAVVGVGVILNVGAAVWHHARQPDLLPGVLEADNRVTIHADGGDVQGLIVPGPTADSRRIILPDRGRLEVWEARREGDPTPYPLPIPDPQPSPTPNKASALFLIHETADGTPATAAVIDAQAWRQSADAAGIRWIVLDDEVAEKQYPRATAKARAVGLPAVVFAEAGGASSAVPMPKVPADMTALVRQHGGK